MLTREQIEEIQGDAREKGIVNLTLNCIINPQFLL